MTPIQWKNTTFLIGLAWLIYGAMYFRYPDWDIPVSLLMAGFTYWSADKFVLAIRKKDPMRVLLWSTAAWWSIDGVYWIYWTIVDSSAAMRAGQWPMSACLYLLCGMTWTAWRSGTRPTDLRRYQRNPE